MTVSADRSAPRFYERLADAYHLLFEDWRSAVVEQGRVLDRLLRRTLGDRRLTVLDCACGIGTQAIGLALRGHTVTATDISPAAVRRLEKEATRFGVEVPARVADMRALSQRVPGAYDLVLACDNALPHLLSDQDLRSAVDQLYGKVLPGGVLLVSLRNYDVLSAERPRMEGPRLLSGVGGRRLVLQLWSWEPDGSAYDFDLLILREEAQGWQTLNYRGRYRALLRRELEQFLRSGGFQRMRWYPPRDSGFYQPILIARKGLEDD